MDIMRFYKDVLYWQSWNITLQQWYTSSVKYMLTLEDSDPPSRTATMLYAAQKN
jgi:hypothetical protein